MRQRGIKRRPFCFGCHFSLSSRDAVGTLSLMASSWSFSFNSLSVRRTSSKQSSHNEHTLAMIRTCQTNPVPLKNDMYCTPKPQYHIIIILICICWSNTSTKKSKKKVPRGGAVNGTSRGNHISVLKHPISKPLYSSSAFKQILH